MRKGCALGIAVADAPLAAHLDLQDAHITELVVNNSHFAMLEVHRASHHYG